MKTKLKAAYHGQVVDLHPLEALTRLQLIALAVGLGLEVDHAGPSAAAKASLIARGACYVYAQTPTTLIPYGYDFKELK